MRGCHNKDGGGSERTAAAESGSGVVSGSPPLPPHVGSRRMAPLPHVPGPFAGPAAGRPVWVTRGGSEFTGPVMGP